MDVPIEIHLRDDVDLSGALLVLGAPGLGFVGSITARYLVEQLGMRRVGGLHSPEFPPFAPIEEGRPLHPVRIHMAETRCGLDLECDRVAVLTSEVFAGPQVVHAMAARLVAWAREIEAPMILVPDAVLSGNKDAPDEAVYGIGATEAALDFVRRADLSPLAEGVMMGLTASLLAEGEHRGVDVAALLAVSEPDHPDARAAARIVEVMDRILPGVPIESGPLRRRAEEIEKSVATIRQQLARQADESRTPGSAPAVEMFR